MPQPQYRSSDSPSALQGDVEREFVEYGLREALGSLVAPDTHDMVFAVSLEHAHLESLPWHGPELASYIRNEFLQTVEAFFGAVVAAACREAVLACLPISLDRAPERLPSLPDTAQHRVLPSKLDADEAPLPNPYLKQTVPAPALGPCTVFIASDSENLAVQASVLLAEGTGGPLVVPAAKVETLVRALRVPLLPIILVLDGRGALDLTAYRRLHAARNPMLSVLAWASKDRLEDAFGDLARLPPRWRTLDHTGDLEDVITYLSNMVGGINPKNI